MGETSIWGYIGLAAVALGFAFGIWRQKRREKKKAAYLAAQAEKENAVGQDEEKA